MMITQQVERIRDGFQRVIDLMRDDAGHAAHGASRSALRNASSA